MTELDLLNKITYQLKHRNEPLSMDTQGWVKTIDLLNLYSINLITLDKIVENDNLTFSYNRDKSKIRANDGHTISFVNIKFKRLKPPVILYHGIDNTLLEITLKNGLIREDNTHVYLHVDKATAYTDSLNKSPIILMIDSERMYNDGYDFHRSSSDGIWIVSHVPNNYIINT